MKIVLDTNVIVSAAMTAHGTSARIIDLLADGAFALCTDDRILAEYEDVLRRFGLRIVPVDAAASESLLVMGNARHYPKSTRAGVSVLTTVELLDLISGSPD